MTIPDYLVPKSHRPRRKGRVNGWTAQWLERIRYRLRLVSLLSALLTLSICLSCGGAANSETDPDELPGITYQPQRSLPDSFVTYAPFEDTVQPDNSLPDIYDTYSPTGPDE